MKFKKAFKIYKYIEDKVQKNTDEVLQLLWQDFIRASFEYARFISDLSLLIEHEEENKNYISSSKTALYLRFVNSCSNMASYLKEAGLDDSWYTDMNHDRDAFSDFACYIHCICGIQTEKNKTRIISKQSVQFKSRVIAVILCIIILISAAYTTWNLNYLHSFWGLLIGLDMIGYFVVPCIIYFKYKSENINDWRAIDRRGSIIGCILVFFITSTYLGLKFKSSLLTGYNGYAVIKFLNHLPGYVLAILVCIGIWGIKKGILQLLRSHSKLHQLDTSVYSTILDYFSFSSYLLVFGLFYTWILSLFAIMIFGGAIISWEELSNFFYLRELIVNIAQNRFHVGQIPCVAYLPQPLLYQEYLDSDLAKELSTLDHPFDDFKYLITCAPYLTLERFLTSPECNKALLWNLDLLLIDQNEIVNLEEKDLYVSFSEKVVKAIECPRTCILSLERSKKVEDCGMNAGGLIHSGSALEKIVIPKVSISNANDEIKDVVRRYLVESFESIYILNKRLFSFLSYDQFTCLDWILSSDIAPISGLMLRMLRTASITERYYILLNFCEAKVRFYAALVLSLSKLRNCELYDNLKEDVILTPNFGKWINVIRSFNSNFRGSAENEGEQDILNFIQKLCQNIEKTESIQVALTMMSNVIQINNLNKNKIKPIDFYNTLVSLRNKTVGHGSVTFNVAESLTYIILTAVLDIESITYHNLESMLLWHSGNQIFNYNGAASVIFHKLIPPDDYISHSNEKLLFYKCKSLQLYLQPWVYRDQTQSRLMFFNGVKSDKIEYLSYESGNIIEPDVKTIERNIKDY